MTENERENLKDLGGDDLAHAIRREMAPYFKMAKLQVPSDGASAHVYLHPGPKGPCSDATVRSVSAPADSWVSDKDTALRNLLGIPQHLRYGKRQAWASLNAILQDVPEQTLVNITVGATEHGEPQLDMVPGHAVATEHGMDMHGRATPADAGAT